MRVGAQEFFGCENKRHGAVGIRRALRGSQRRRFEAGRSYRVAGRHCMTDATRVACGSLVRVHDAAVCFIVADFELGCDGLREQRIGDGVVDAERPGEKRLAAQAENGTHVRLRRLAPAHDEAQVGFAREEARIGEGQRGGAGIGHLDLVDAIPAGRRRHEHARDRTAVHLVAGPEGHTVELVAGNARGFERGARCAPPHFFEAKGALRPCRGMQAEAQDIYGHSDRLLSRPAGRLTKWFF